MRASTSKSLARTTSCPRSGLSGEYPLSIDQILHVLADPHAGPHGSKLKFIDTSLDASRPFEAIGGHLPAWLWLLPVGAVLLIAAFGLIVVDLGLTAWRRPTGPARFVLVGLAALCSTVAFGAVFAFALAGRAGSTGELMLASGVPLHAIAGLGGWLTLTAMGVSYRLLSMFMLSSDVDDRKSGTTLVAGTLTIAVTVIGGILAIGFSSGLNVVLSIAAILGLATAALYGRDVVGIFRGRQRRQLELNMRMATLSFASPA